SSWNHSLPFIRNSENAAFPSASTRTAALLTSASISFALAEGGGDDRAIATAVPSTPARSAIPANATVRFIFLSPDSVDAVNPSADRNAKYPDIVAAGDLADLFGAEAAA